MENRAYSDVIGNRDAPYLNRLARDGESLTAMHGVAHPSQPNYIALFSGFAHGIRTDDCPQRVDARNLATELRAKHLRFAGYSEGLPKRGSTTCYAGAYARKHVPWTNFGNVSRRVNEPLTAFPSDYSRLPAVSFVIPNLEHDMHDGSIRAGDAWLHRQLGRYATWTRAHRSLLIVTWDEDDFTAANHIPTVIVGAGVHPHRVGTPANTYSLLRLIEDRFHLHRLGLSASAPPVRLG